jgi:oxygen-dependent protoporphyrinogen oxidase
VLACTWTSAKFAGRAPAGQALFRLFVGGAGRHGLESLSDDALLVLAAAEMRAIMGITARPTLCSVNRFDRALPQYTVGHLDRMKAIAAEAARIPGLELAGAVYRGVGIPDCVQSGVDAASRALAAVRARPPLITSLS